MYAVGLSIVIVVAGAREGGGRRRRRLRLFFALSLRESCHVVIILCFETDEYEHEHVDEEAVVS